MAIKSCGSDSHGVTMCDPSPGHSPMGLGRSLDLRLMEKVAGGKNRVDRINATYQSWAGRTRCYSFPCTGVTNKDSDDWIHRIGVSKLRYFGGAEDCGVPASLVIRCFWNLYVPIVWRPFAVRGAPLASSTELISS